MCFSGYPEGPKSIGFQVEEEKEPLRSVKDRNLIGKRHQSHYGIEKLFYITRDGARIY